MNRRALAISLLVAVIGVALMLLYQQRFEQEASGGERISVLQVVKQIDRGTVITEEMVTTRKIPLAYVEERAVKEAEKSKIVGLPVTNTVRAQQTLLWTDIVNANEERKDLSQLVIPGFRAVTVRVAREDTSVALVRPGDYVDVVVVLGANSNAEQKTAAVILQKILVLAAGNDTSQNREEKRTIDARDAELITFALRLDEAQMISLAAERGRITVAVRPPSDSQTSERLPDFTSDRLLSPTSRPVIRGGGPAQPTGPINIGRER